MDAATTNYILGVAGAVIMSLLGAIWAMVRAEAKRTAEALEKKASATALQEAKNDAARQLDQIKREAADALNSVREHMERQLERQTEDNSRVIAQLADRQESEIDWLKREMDKFSQELARLRQENAENTRNILAEIRNLHNSARERIS